MKLFDRPEGMRFTWSNLDEYRQYVRTIEWSKRRSGKSSDDTYYRLCNTYGKIDWMSDYLIEGIDETLCEQPFLPKKSHMIARAFYLKNCIFDALSSDVIVRSGHRLHHNTSKSLMTQGRLHRWDETDIGDHEYVWYIFGGRIFKTPTENSKRWAAFDLLFITSPEVRHVRSLLH